MTTTDESQPKMENLDQTEDEELTPEEAEAVQGGRRTSRRTSRRTTARMVDDEGSDPGETDGVA